MKYRIDVGYVGDPDPLIERAWRRCPDLEAATAAANRRLDAERAYILRHDSNATIKVTGSWRRDRAKCIEYTASPAKHPDFGYPPAWVAIVEDRDDGA